MRKSPFIQQVILITILLIIGCQNEHEVHRTKETKKRVVLEKTSKKKKVLLVGIDGLQIEKISNTATPNLDKLLIKKGYSGGITGTASEQKTKSGPGWTTILTGVWLNKHGVPDNSSSHKSKVKSVFQLIKEHDNNLETASVATWSPIHDFLRDQLQFINYKHQGGNDDNAVKNSVNELTNHNPDFLFVHLDEVDGVGHSSGFGSSYNSAISRADKRLGTIMNAVENRINTKNEDWLIIVTTDHGRENSGYGHGNQTTSEKTIFVGMNKPGNAEFNNYIGTIPNKDFNGIYGNIAQTSIIPTVLTHLNIPIKKEWQLTSTSLIGGVGAQKVMMKNSNTLYWHASTSGNIEIYRNNQFLTNVNSLQGYYVDTAPSKGDTNYTLLLNGQTSSVAINNTNIIAGLDWNDFINNKAYFFRDDIKYVRYNKTLDKADSGYPIQTNNSSWPGLGNYKNLISAAFKWSNHKGFFFLNDGRYIRYDMNTDTADAGYPITVTNQNWPGLEVYAKKIVAAINWNNSKAYFFLNDGTYLRYSITNDKVDSGYPKPINNSTWPGLGNYGTNITATVDWNLTYCYFFLNNNTYIKYNKTLDKAVSGYPKPINNATWPGLK